MNHVPGGNLYQHISENQPVPLATVQLIFAGIVQGVAAMHSRGFVHRDIKVSAPKPEQVTLRLRPLKCLLHFFSNKTNTPLKSKLLITTVVAAQTSNTSACGLRCRSLDLFLAPFFFYPPSHPPSPRTCCSRRNVKPYSPTSASVPALPRGKL